MPRFGWVKNHTPVAQYFGRYCIPPGSVGQIPFEIALQIKDHPIRGLTVIDDRAGDWVFSRTVHRPWNARHAAERQ